MSVALVSAAETTPDLADEIATLAAHLSAATARLLELIAAYDARGDWHRAGFRSCAHFLNWRIGLDLGAAREHVRVAHALEGLPALRAAFARGELSYSKVRAVTRIARPETEDELHAEGRVSAETLPPALRPARPNAAGPQRRADALVRVAERALAGGAGPGPAERYQVVVHVDAEVLADPAADGRCHHEDGPALAPETVRRLACDCDVVTIRHHVDGRIEPGRRRRVLSAPLRRALAARDGKVCIWPGCECRLGLQPHHLEHWAQGGATTLDNSVWVCAFCHVRLHEGGYRVVRDPAGALRIQRPDGGLIPAVGELPRLSADPVGDLVQRHAAGSLAITSETALPGWQGETFDCDAAVTWLLGAEPGSDRVDDPERASTSTPAP